MKFLIIVLSALVALIDAHGMMMDPINRSSAWRVNFSNPVNYNDNELFCGGVTVQHVKNQGKCGECGDDYSLPRPRPNENGGFYGNGLIVKRYVKNSEIQVVIWLTTNHRGTFELSICPLNDPSDLETDECFAKYPVLLSNNSRLYTIQNSYDGPIGYKVKLPSGLTCKHCVMRWHWRVANTWGECKDGTSAVGCGNQETFRSCSDISIVDSLPNGQIFEIPPESPKVTEPIYTDNSHKSEKHHHSGEPTKTPVEKPITVTVAPTTPKPDNAKTGTVDYRDPLWAVTASSQKPIADTTPKPDNSKTGTVDYRDPLWAVTATSQKPASDVTVDFNDPLWAVKKAKK